ncbi:leucine-rich repeat-containing 15 isoform A [Chlorella sorokiniana]|uniref:Leucine-rich repeat-containing 15 isoform A n=1 Tax=Chlorella sorokiniana TaxID=3076 RepID=A0A2P6U041_CHLSO|nr:leucine-rich repeat-containing 15 isoform A [Chlorella sorokiniana]|eukprot:PRW59683.1 leucine-rich repeat-containing 15 isoform A [Chlorella sorokiniana]
MRAANALSGSPRGAGSRPAARRTASTSRRASEETSGTSDSEPAVPAAATPTAAAAAAAGEGTITIGNLPDDVLGQILTTLVQQHGWEHGAAAAQLLPRFAHLRNLAVRLKGGSPSHTGADLGAALEQLPQLETFKIAGVHVQQALLASVCRLPCLKELCLHAQVVPLPSMAGLTALASTLTSLSLVEWKSFRTGLQLPPLAALSKLDSLTVGAHVLQIPGAGTLLKPLLNAAGWAELVQQEGEDSDLLPVPQITSSGLAAGQVAVQVANVRLAAAGMLAAVLEWMVPAGSHLASLQLSVCGVAPATWQGCGPHLAAAKTLLLGKCCDIGVHFTLAPALDSLLRHAPLVEQLAVTTGKRASGAPHAHCALPRGPPPALASMHHLTSLALSGTRLPHMDGVLEGLPGLMELNLELNCLQQLPAGLSCCTQLTRLVLYGNEKLVLNGDAVRILHSLPALTEVRLPQRRRPIAMLADAVAAQAGLTKAEMSSSPPAEDREPPQAPAGHRSPALPPPPCVAGGRRRGGLTISDLPDDLLGLILTVFDDAVGSRQGRVVTEVCTRWKRVYYSASCVHLWRASQWKIAKVELEDERRMAAGLRLFERTGRMVEWAMLEAEAEAEWQQAAAPHLPAFLALLSPAGLKWLHISRVPLTAAALQALVQFRQLRELGVEAAEAADVADGLAAALGQLGSLDAFRFNGSCVDDTLLAALCRLPRLESLELHSKAAPLPAISPLTALAGSLTSLSLLERTSSDSGLQLLPAAAFPKLQELLIAAPVIKLPGSGRLRAAAHAGSWDLKEIGDLGEANFDPACWLRPVPTIVAGCVGEKLMLDIQNTQLAAQAGLLPALLEATVPAGRSVTGLSLRVCRLAPPAFHGCAQQLAAADQLALLFCFSDSADQSLQPALEALLRQTPALEELMVFCEQRAPWHGCLAGGLPAAVTTLRSLEALSLIGTRLPHLEGVLEGLPGLNQLDLRMNRLQRLPAALPRCTQLTSLHLGWNDGLTAHGLDDAAVSLFATLPALRELELPGAVCEQALPGVNINDLPDDLLGLILTAFNLTTDRRQGRVVTELQAVDLHSIASPLPPLDALTALGGSLTQLELIERKSHDNGLQLPTAAAFPKLAQLFVASPVLRVPGSGSLAALTPDGKWELEKPEEGEGNRLRNLDGVLEGLPELAHLDVRMNRLEQLPAAFRRCTKLTTLLLAYNTGLAAEGLDTAALSLLGSLPELRVLHLPFSSGWRQGSDQAAQAVLAAAAPQIEEIEFADELAYGDGAANSDAEEEIWLGWGG